MKRQIAAIGCCCLILLAAWGCSNGKAPVALNSVSATASAFPESSATVSLEWRQTENRRPIDPMDDLKAVKERIVKQFPLNPFPDAVVTVYARKGDREHMFAAIHFKGIDYDLGTAGGYAYDKEGDYEISNPYLFGRQTLKITGSVGANALLTHYVDFEGNRPESLLFVDTGMAQEKDLDHDGKPELVVSSGLPMHTDVYRYSNGKIEMADLNRSLGADSVTVNRENVIEAVSSAVSVIRLYRLTNIGLRPFAEIPKGEYVSPGY